MMMHEPDCSCKRCTGRLRADAPGDTFRFSHAAGNAKPGVMDPKPKRRPTQRDIRKAMQPKERDVSKSIESQLNGAGVWNSRTQSANVKLAGGGYMRIGTPGTPDRIAAVGLHVWIEVKAPGKEPSPEQIAAIETLKANGALAFVLDDPRDLDFIFCGLREHVGTVAEIDQMIRYIQDDIDAAIAAAKGKR